MYYAMANERFPISEVDVSQVDRKWWRTEVDYPTTERAGTVVVDTPMVVVVVDFLVVIR